ncbi:hypothetical protein [Pantoea leporis]|jgi:hypothetical protein|uniref:hypothetical protein n=1 Tax=Pantoea leporis TaxID=2933780 RepID=UPI00230307F5|nr:hypothetical protein [Pantoea leporis]
MMKFLATIFFIVSLTAKADLPNGIWSTECGASDAFDLKISNSLSGLVVNDNQIVVQYASVMASENKVDLYFIKPIDLGRGGMTINWSNVSGEMRIAELAFSGDSGVLNWSGFYDISDNKYVWINEPDFVQNYSEHGAINLKHCSH